VHAGGVREVVRDYASRRVSSGLLQHRAGSGPQLVLLPGLGLSWHCWRPVLGALEVHHDVAAFDLPGFGAAPPLPRDVSPTPAALADAVAGELERLGSVRPALVGNSLGGWVALELARRGRASRVVAIAPNGLELPHERAYVTALNQAMRMRAKLGARIGRREMSLPPVQTALFSGLHARPWRVDAQDGIQELRSFAGSRGFQPTLGSIAPRSASGLSRIDVPVRIVFGTRDVMLGSFVSPRFAALIPQADLVALPGVGHVPMADDPRLVAQAILDFTAPG
jgi:pimeloyl-ACP methyl ester carboxylesterase